MGAGCVLCSPSGVQKHKAWLMLGMSSGVQFAGVSVSTVSFSLLLF